MTPDGAASAAQRGVLRLVDQALEVQAPLVRTHIARIRARNPKMSPADVIRKLNRELRAATIGSGAAVGGSAAAPGVGTGAALVLSAGEAVGFMNATALYVLARAELQGISLRDIERRRALLMAIMLGDAGAKSVSQVAERTGQHWARALISSIPMSSITKINRVLGPNFVTKYGTTRGVVVLGRIIPFGVGAAIGATANAIFSQGVITASDRAFGPPPTREGVSLAPAWGYEEDMTNPNDPLPEPSIHPSADPDPIPAPNPEVEPGGTPEIEPPGE